MAGMFEAFRCRPRAGAKLLAPALAARAASAPPPAGQPPEEVVQPPATPSLKRSRSAAQQSSAAKPAKSLRVSIEAVQTVPLQPGPPRGVPENLGDAPLRLIIVGHNPSQHAWQTGHYYSNPTNWFWRLLKTSGIATPCIRGAQDDKEMPRVAGVGMLDVGCGVPGTLSAAFSSAVLASWAPAFYARLAAHQQRAAASVGCKCGLCGAPALVAFAGKRQWCELLNVGRKGKDKVTKVELGLQPAHQRPTGWPFPPSTEVWVMTSTSGASALTTAERLAPWCTLNQRLQQLPWPRQPTSCRSHLESSHSLSRNMPARP